MKFYLKIIGLVVLFLVVAAVGVYFSYYVWSAEHPNAPFWTFFFSAGR